MENQKPQMSDRERATLIASIVRALPELNDIKLHAVYMLVLHIQ